MTDQAVRVVRSGPVTTVSLHRPARRNAVDGPTAAELAAAFRAFDAVLHGYGRHPLRPLRRLALHRAAEWVLRIIISLVTTPGDAVDIDDPAAIRAFLTDFLVAGLGD